MGAHVGAAPSAGAARRCQKDDGRCNSAGARVLCGGKRHGAIYEATLLEHVPWDAQIVQDEAFGPVACLFPYKGYKKAIEMCAAAHGLALWFCGSGAARGLLECWGRELGSSSAAVQPELKGRF
jgi:acyl-CoA reductase-like NAD-dependent aldehyde dehydrogenase